MAPTRRFLDLPKDVEFFRRQHGHEANERQSDQIRRVVSGQLSYQRDAQAFGFESAGAIIRTLASNITPDSSVAKVAKCGRRGFNGDLAATAFAVEHADTREKRSRRAANRLELTNCIGFGAGFVQDSGRGQGDLIRPDDQRCRVTRCHGARFGFGKTRDKRVRGFCLVRRLIDFRRVDHKLGTDALQELAPIG